MAYNNKNNKGNSRLSNGPKYDPNHKRGTPTNNVKGGVFVYTGSITVSELAKQLNQSVSDILKYLFLNKKIMATLNTTLDDEIIGEFITANPADTPPSFEFANLVLTRIPILDA